MPQAPSSADPDREAFGVAARLTAPGAAPRYGGPARPAARPAPAAAMSLIAPAWHASAKRSFGDQSSDGDDIINDGTAAKARRLRGSSFAAAGCRAQPAADRQAYTVGPSAVAALRALFPAMNDQARALYGCKCSLPLKQRALGGIASRRRAATDAVAAVCQGRLACQACSNLLFRGICLSDVYEFAC